MQDKKRAGQVFNQPTTKQAKGRHKDNLTWAHTLTNTDGHLPGKLLLFTSPFATRAETRSPTTALHLPRLQQSEVNELIPGVDNNANAYFPKHDTISKLFFYTLNYIFKDVLVM